MKVPDNGVNGLGRGMVIGIDDQIWVVRRQIIRIDADQGVDLAVFRLGVQSFRVALGAGFDGTLDVDDNQITNAIEDKTPGILACRQRGNDGVDTSR